MLSKLDENGNYIENPAYKEIHVLNELLNKAGIPHTMKRFRDGWQICYPVDEKGRVMDAIEYHGSYGVEEDLLEIMGLLTPEEKSQESVLGHLTAQEVFERIKRHYMEVTVRGIE